MLEVAQSPDLVAAVTLPGGSHAVELKGRNSSDRRVRIRRGAVLGAAFALVATQARSEDPSAGRGAVLIARHCGGCHAVGASGGSPHPAAPPLRELHRRYEPETLAEALAEGILTGHPAMPEFRFDAPDVQSIILYLNQIQDRQKSQGRPPETRSDQAGA